MDDTFGRSTVCKEGKSVPRINIYSSKEKVLLFLLWKADHLREQCHIRELIFISIAEISLPGVGCFVLD